MHFFRTNYPHMKILCSCVLLLLGPFLFAQDSHLLPQLKAAFEPAYLHQVQQSNPILLKRWTYYATHAFYVSEDMPQKYAKTLPTIDIDPSNINIFLLEKEYPFLKRDWDKPMAYKIKNTNQLLVYYSGKRFMENFKTWLGKNTK